jgi:Arc/MetJ-type ribon-helix-helix transcriptional regulator
MKLSVSLSDDDVAFLDSYARDASLGSRSAAMQRAVRLLRSSQLADEYAAAWDEWVESGEAEAWDVTLGDGLTS